MSSKDALTQEQLNELINSIEVLENEQMWVMRVVDEQAEEVNVN
jgi:uncharacterized protein (UPF0335 family)